jgi:Tripartite tricarboxylate transporter TctB family
MLLYRVQGVIFTLLGIGSTLEAWRITQAAREGGNFDAIGPDRYLLALGVLMTVIGTWMALRPPVIDQFGPLPEQPKVGATFYITVAMLAALTATLPYIGFPVASFVFLTVMFHRFGGWSWLRSSAVSIVVAAIFYITFVRMADLPLPHGNLIF